MRKTRTIIALNSNGKCFQIIAYVRWKVRFRLREKPRRRQRREHDDDDDDEIQQSVGFGGFLP